MAGQLKITWKRARSATSRTRRTRFAPWDCGVCNQTVVHEDTPTIRGMIFKVRHLVEVERNLR